MKKVQVLQNLAAKIVLYLPKHSSATEALDQLGWDPGGGGTWVFFGWVCAARDSILAPRSKKFPLKLIPRSRIRPKTDTPF